MCRERNLTNKQVDNTTNEQYDQLLQQLHTELNELLLTTESLQEESKKLEIEAQNLINENIKIQIDARLLRDKYRYRKRYSKLKRKKSFNFKQLKYQIKHQRKSFSKFERNLRAKYERPFQKIVSNKTKQCRRIRSMPSESID